MAAWRACRLQIAMQLLLVVIILLFLTLIPKLVSASLLRRKTKTNTHTWFWHNVSCSPYSIKWINWDWKWTWHQFVNSKADIALMMKHTGSNTFCFCYWQMLYSVLYELTYALFFLQAAFRQLRNQCISSPLPPGFVWISPWTLSAFLPCVGILLGSHTCLSFGNSFQREMLGGEERLAWWAQKLTWIHFTAHIFIEHWLCVWKHISLYGVCKNAVDKTASPKEITDSNGRDGQTNYTSQNVESVLKIKV